MTGSRGRPRRVDPEETVGRAMNFRIILGNCGVWAQVSDALLRARTEADVVGAFSAASAYYADKFTRGTMAGLLMAALNDRDFPKSRTEAQIAFLADSLAAAGDVSPRRSRQICREERRRTGASPDEYLPSWDEKMQAEWRKQNAKQPRRARSVTGEAVIGWLSTDPSGTKRG